MTQTIYPNYSNKELVKTKSTFASGIMGVAIVLSVGASNVSAQPRTDLHELAVQNSQTVNNEGYDRFSIEATSINEYYETKYSDIKLSDTSYVSASEYQPEFVDTVETDTWS